MWISSKGRLLVLTQYGFIFTPILATESYKTLIMNENVSKQLTIEGFPIPKEKELYTAPPKNLPDRYAKRSFAGKRQFEPLIPMISINPDYFCIYNRRESQVSRKEGDELRAKHKEKLKQDLTQAKKVKRILNTGTLSRSGRSRMRRACGYLFYASSDKTIHNRSEKNGFKQHYDYTMRLAVMTLTLPGGKQLQDDKTMKRVLYKNYIDALRKHYPALQYVWRAETQGNGCLHFHIIVDHFIPVWYSNRLWVNILRRNGYFEGQRHLKIELINSFPVDTKKVKNEKCLARYMRKYMMKGLDKNSESELLQKIRESHTRAANCSTPSEAHKESILTEKLVKRYEILTRRKVEGKIWGCSDNLILKPYSDFYEPLAMQMQGIPECKMTWNDKYTEVYEITDFASFLKGFSTEAKEKLLAYYGAVFPKKMNPFNEFYSNQNYTYAYGNGS